MTTRGNSGRLFVFNCWKLSDPAHPTKRQSESLASEDDLVARLLLRLTCVFHIVDTAQNVFDHCDWVISHCTNVVDHFG